MGGGKPRSATLVFRFRHSHRDYLIAALAVDSKVSVQRDDLSGLMLFRESDEARIRQWHWPISVTAHQRSEIRLLAFHCNRDSYDSPLHERKQSICVVASRFNRNTASVSTGSQLSSGGRSSFHCSTAHS
jgi:hypothetical protein